MHCIYLRVQEVPLNSMHKLLQKGHLLRCDAFADAEVVVGVLLLAHCFYGLQAAHGVHPAAAILVVARLEKI